MHAERISPPLDLKCSMTCLDHTGGGYMSVKKFATKILPLPILARVAFYRQFWFVGERELREIEGLLPKRGLALDVGANVGTYSRALKNLGLDVVSFEPDQNYQVRLRALLGDSARIEEVALSSHSGSSVMRVPVSRHGYGGGLASLSSQAVPDDKISSSYNVELRTLDSYDFRDVVFIKIDVEGHEEGVLDGASETLERWKPVLLIEIEERHNLGGLERIATKLAKLGYSGSFFYDNKRHLLSEFDPAIHQVFDDTMYDMKVRTMRYVNNFVFVAR